jgi:hypothetical protein
LIWISKRVKVLCGFIQKPPNFSADGFYRILSSYLLAHFYLMKKSANVKGKEFGVSKCIPPAEARYFYISTPSIYVHLHLYLFIQRQLYGGFIPGFIDVSAYFYRQVSLVWRNRSFLYMIARQAFLLLPNLFSKQFLKKMYTR